MKVIESFDFFILMTINLLAALSLYSAIINVFLTLLTSSTFQK